MSQKIIIIGATSFVAQRFIKYYTPYFKEKKLVVTLTYRTKSKLPQFIIDDSFFKFKELNILNREDVFSAMKGHYLVINFAGPFDLYGKFVVEASCELGIHYLDITGEFQFAKKNMNNFHEEAIKNKARIVSFCGFDSVPSEYAVYLSSQIAKEKNTQVDSIDILFSLRGGFNGGTIKTALEFKDKIPKEDFLNRSYLLENTPPSYLETNSARYIKELNSWGIPFFMEPINSKVVYSSCYNWEKENFKDNFIYQESMKIHGGKLANTLGAFISTKTDYLFKNALTKKILASLLPKPGEGPSEELIENGFMKAKVVTRFTDGTFTLGTIDGKGDPGNLITLKCIGSAMKATLDHAFPNRFGVLTPAGAFGGSLLPYLESESIHFNFHRHI